MSIAMLSTCSWADNLANSAPSSKVSQKEKSTDKIYSTKAMGQTVPNEKTLSTNSLNKEDAATAQVKNNIKQRLPGLTITAVEHTPYPDLFEVRVEDQILYTNKDTTWVISGELTDLFTLRNVTQERQDILDKISFEQLPQELAIKQVKGRGTRQIAIFEDPNCRYCKEFHKVLDQVKDITIYTYLYPVLGSDSHLKAHNIWCAQDRSQAFRDWMLKNISPVDKTCNDSLDQLLSLGKKLKIKGTPTIFFVDGSRTGGMMSLAQLQKRLK